MDLSELSQKVGDSPYGWDKKGQNRDLCSSFSQADGAEGEGGDSVWEEGLGHGLSCPLSPTPQGRGSQGQYGPAGFQSSSTCPPSTLYEPGINNVDTLVLGASSPCLTLPHLTACPHGLPRQPAAVR